MKQEAYFCTVKELDELGKNNIPRQLISHTHLIYSSPATLAFNSPGAEGFGVKRAGLAVPDSIMLIVSPGCCGRNTSVLSSMRAYHDRFYYLLMDETDIVTGRHLKKIPKAVAEICEGLEKKPSVVMICITCVDALLGTDMERVCHKAEEYAGIPVKPCYMYALTREGRKPPMVHVRQSIYSLLEPKKKKGNVVNLLGYFSPLVDDCELYDLLHRAGVKTIHEISRCRDYAEYQTMSEANFNLVLHPEARFAAEDFHDRLKIPYIELRRLYQIDKIASQYRAFGAALGVEFDDEIPRKAAEDAVATERDIVSNRVAVRYTPRRALVGDTDNGKALKERIQELNKEIGVTCFGQEFNPSTFAIAKADMMIRGGDPNNMRFGDTLSEDQFSGYQFQYIISNPPFGIDWKREKTAVEAEAKKGELGRFAPGLPKISDGQQLFVLNGLSKLAPNGKMAIIQNGSPLFSGDAGSGPSEIRRYILENDWLDAIVQLGTDMFMNTGISTYIWICSKDKPVHRAGKVQLIDASHCFEARRKSIGTKRNDITDKCRDLIVKAYGAFENGTVYGEKNGIYCQSKIFDTEEFGYQKIVVEQPQKDENGETILKKGKPVADVSLRDTENVPLTEEIEEYFKREVLPYAPEAWIDEKKTKKGYEIPMTRYFYEYQAPEPVGKIAVRLHELELDIQSSLDALFGEK